MCFNAIVSDGLLSLVIVNIYSGMFIRRYYRGCLLTNLVDIRNAEINDVFEQGKNRAKYEASIGLLEGGITMHGVSDGACNKQ
jgi:hypothetical protein